jgi:hypothetical protein
LFKFISGCQSTWTRQLELIAEKGKVEMTHTADTLERQLTRGALFGGDLESILKIVSSTLTRIKDETANDAQASDDRDDQVTKTFSQFKKMLITRKVLFRKNE